jgi:Fe-Mn family superoxide dismutase
MMADYKLPKLPYEFDELEPVISAEILQLHYNKHHAGYVNNLNDAVKKLREAEAKGDLVQQIMLNELIKFNGGGHINHSLYWENLVPQSKGGGELRDGELKSLIIETFGSVDHLIEIISSMCNSVQGSGWGWLGYCTVCKQLRPCSTEKHDLVLTKNAMPLLCIDVWEHAYYLQYKNLRADYVKNIWSIVNWNVVEQRFADLRKR